MNKFHWQKGWYFARATDGAVVVTREGTPEDKQAGGPLRLVIPAAEWASIVAHVADGGSAEAYRAAETLHKIKETT